MGQGEMSEWFKERAWKVRIPQKGIGGSNPPLSARPESVRARIATMLQSFFCALPTPSLLERGIREQKRIHYAVVLDLPTLCLQGPRGERRGWASVAQPIPQEMTKSTLSMAGAASCPLQGPPRVPTGTPSVGLASQEFAVMEQKTTGIKKDTRDLYGMCGFGGRGLLGVRLGGVIGVPSA